MAILGSLGFKGIARLSGVAVMTAAAVLAAPQASASEAKFLEGNQSAC